MAESEFQEGNYDDMGKMRENIKKDVEELLEKIENVENFKKDTGEVLEKIENLTVRAARVTYDFIAIRTNPDLTNTMQHLEDAFLRCKEQMEKKEQEVLMESRGEGQKKVIN